MHGNRHTEHVNVTSSIKLRCATNLKKIVTTRNQGRGLLYRPVFEIIEHTVMSINQPIGRGNGGLAHRVAQRAAKRDTQQKESHREW